MGTGGSGSWPHAELSLSPPVFVMEYYKDTLWKGALIFLLCVLGGVFYLKSEKVGEPVAGPRLCPRAPRLGPGKGHCFHSPPPGWVIANWRPLTPKSSSYFPILGAVASSPSRLLALPPPPSSGSWLPGPSPTGLPGLLRLLHLRDPGRPLAPPQLHAQAAPGHQPCPGLLPDLHQEAAVGGGALVPDLRPADGPDGRYGPCPGRGAWGSCPPHRTLTPHRLPLACPVLQPTGNASTASSSTAMGWRCWPWLACPTSTSRWSSWAGGSHASSNSTTSTTWMCPRAT
ncbi:unnamed protein product [Eretmochelys imbricata]